MLFPHLYFGDEIDISLEKRNWLGLYPEDDKSSLKPAQVSITLTRHHMTDAEGEKTGKRVTVLPEKPTMLISGLNNLRPGPVNDIDLKTTSIQPGDTITLSLFEKQYQLVATGNTTTQGNFTDCKLYLTSEGQKQLIGESDFFDDTTFRVIWAGDLDGDQELDLILDLSYKYSFGLFTLFTSTNKEAQELLHLVAQHRMYYD